ncbi:hypothetical protein X798_06097 [Onchocerca flexuosa]|uniref:Uncharacterized protein n=1 Tax=Onchocerca flexuosa TaxID=387005 RepID=A0A238BNA8_9BILA|nr:hypothetical protein X798_06097 [Onchocerca flexuosa]
MKPKEKIVEDEKKAEVKMKKPKEESVEEVKPKEKIVEDKKKKSEVKMEKPKEKIAEEMKPKEKTVEDQKKKAEAKMGKPKEEIAEEMKLKEKTVEDQKKKAEAKMEKPKEEIVEEMKPKEKIVENKKKAEVMEKPKEKIGEEVKTKEKIVEDKEKKAEVKMEKPKEKIVEAMKPKEKTVEEKRKAEAKMEEPKEEMENEKIVDDKKKAEAKMEQPKKEMVEMVTPKEKIVDKKKAEAKMEQLKEEMVEEVKPKEKTVEDKKKKAGVEMEKPKVEIVEKVVKSKEKIAETEFGMHLPGVKVFLTKETSVSLCVEKPSECYYIDSMDTQAVFCCCNLSVFLPGLGKAVKDVKEKMERPIREKHSEEIPVETVSVSFEFTKQRTQKIGVGTIFNSERPTEQIELTEEIKRRSPRGDAVQVLTVGEKCSACTSFRISAADINKTVSDIPKKNLKDSSISVIADIEVDSGEEIATTDAIVDVLKMFEETELVITDFASDIFDVDVTLDALMEEEFIEAIGPVFHNQLASLVVQMSTAVVAISRLIEETKILSANAEAEISMSVATETEIQELNLKLQKAGHESLKNFGT